MSRTDPPTEVPVIIDSAGARGLLIDCVGGRSGESLLIVVEAAGSGYHDHEAPQLIAVTARSMGMTVYQTEAPPALANALEIDAFVGTLQGFDHVAMFARVGDQIRFEGAAHLPSTTMCYVLDSESLDSPFGTACHVGLCEVKALIDGAILQAEDIHVTCPVGTDYRRRGTPRVVDASVNPSVEVSIKRFPMLVPRPVDMQGFTGRVVLRRFLTGTGSHYYEPYSMRIRSDVHAIVDGHRLVRFEGHRDEVARVNAHYEDIASRYNVDPWHVHSWHAGIHPACVFSDDAWLDMPRWSGSAFGNPRLLHFHTCGDYAPGEISWTVLDPTVTIDGVALWEQGRLYPERLAGGAEVMTRHPRLDAHYRSPGREVGLAD